MPDLPVPVQTVDPTPSQIVALLTGGLKFGKSFGMPFPPLWRPVSSPKALTRLRMQVLIYDLIVQVKSAREPFRHDLSGTCLHMMIMRRGHVASKTLRLLALLAHCLRYQILGGTVATAT